MFERFTDRARRVLVHAQEEARLLQHDFIGTEHILLGLMDEGEGVGAKALSQLGLTLDGLREAIEAKIGRGDGVSGGAPPFTPRAKKVLELSLREALQLGHNYIGTEHMLLGLIHEGEGVASQVLAEAGADLASVRQTVITLLAGYGAGPSRAVGGPATPAGEALLGAARRRAGSGPLGTHHYLEAMLDDAGSLAAKVLASLGVTAQAVAERIRALGTSGTTDELKGASRARFEMRFDEGFSIRVDDEALAERVAAALAASQGKLGTMIRDALLDTVTTASPPPAPPEGEAGPPAKSEE